MNKFVIYAQGKHARLQASKQARTHGLGIGQARTLCYKNYYNIARVLVLYKSYWAAMNKIFIYARPCVNKMT